MAQLPSFVRFQPMEKPRLRDTFTGAGDDVLDLLQQLLAFDPAQRLTAAQALRHPYFVNAPRPTAPERLPRCAPAQAPAVAGTKRPRDGEPPRRPDADAPDSPNGDEPAPRRRLVFS